MPEPLLKVLQQMKLSPKELLKPDPTLEFHPEQHRYYDIKKKHWVRGSVSEIAKKGDWLSTVLKRPNEDKDRIAIEESIKRGNTVHECVEHWFKTGKVLDAGDYRAWVNQFINYENLKGWECIASEYRLIDRLHDIAGTLDFILEKDGRLALCDLKTRSPNFSKNHMNVKTQLGGYLSLLGRALPSLEISTCRVYWVTPEQCTTDDYDTITCLELYESARRVYNQSKPNF